MLLLSVLAHLDRENLIDDDLGRWVAQLERIDGANSLVINQNLATSVDEVSVYAAKLILQNRCECGHVPIAKIVALREDNDSAAGCLTNFRIQIPNFVRSRCVQVL